MKTAYLFPGQGSQFRGMGEELFKKFSHIIQQADAQLGYSIEELCLKDPQRQLNKTQFTQPALYTINVLSYLDKLDQNGREPDYVAGHSLGEYSALFAAGAFDYLTGLKLVQKRGALMSEAPKGAMAAILDIDQADVKTIIDNSAYNKIDIANINSRKQCIISGLYDDIFAIEKDFIQAGANFIPLNVSAAFHSRYMQSVRDEFAGFLSGFQLQPLKIPVVANFTARLYPTKNYADYLNQQISNPVRWYESISWLLQKEPGILLEEIGPGEVLTKMVNFIRESPLELEPDIEPELEQPPQAVEEDAAHRGRVQPARGKQLIFMFVGQGAQYYQMGRELYQNNPVFRRHMDNCSDLLKPVLGAALNEIIYDESKKSKEFDELLFTHPALFSFGYSLARMLMEEGYSPAGVLGHSLGEYVAAVIAGVLTLEDGLALVAKQARILTNTCRAGGLISVLDSPDLFEQRPELFSGAALAGLNYSQSFFLSGLRENLNEVKVALERESIFAVELPVRYGFHSEAIDPGADEFKQYAATVTASEPEIPLYSAVLGKAVGRDVIENPREYLWSVVRNRINFQGLFDSTFTSPADYVFVDLSPTATLSGFLKYGFGDRYQHYYAVNQFGRNIDSIDSLVNSLKEIYPIVA